MAEHPSTSLVAWYFYIQQPYFYFRYVRGDRCSLERGVVHQQVTICPCWRTRGPGRTQQIARPL